MAALELLEVLAAFGLITLVWFLLLGWRLVPPSRPRFGRRGW